MKGKYSRIYPQKWVQIGILIGICFVLYFLNLHRWDLWNPDEPRYGQVAKEMVNRGDWVLMHYNGNVYPDKPPLFFWAVAISSFFRQGFTSFSVRFPSALFGTLTVLLTFLIGKRFYSSRVGFLSGLILATSLEFAYLSTRANIDTMLTFFTTGSLYFFSKWYGDREGKGKEGGKAGDFSIYGFYVGMALATLAKGPVGLILPLVVGLLYLATLKDWKAMREMRLLTGMLLFFGIVLSWYLPAVIRGGEDYLHATLLRQTIERYSEGWSKPRPIYYYLYNFPFDFLPWIFFLPGAIVYGYSRKRFEKRKEFFFLILWFFLIFLFFSLSKGKRGLYLLPLYPAVSLLVGKLWDDLIFTPMEHLSHHWISFPLYGLMGLTLVGGAAIPWAVSMKYPSYLPYSLPIAFLMVGSSLAMLVLYRFKDYGTIFVLILGMMAGSFFYTSRVLFPTINPYKSVRFISREITSRMLPGEKLGVYGRVGAAPYNFYTGVVPILEVNTPEELLDFLKSPERVFCVIPIHDFSQFEQREGGPKVQLIARRNTGNLDHVLISNK